MTTVMENTIEKISSLDSGEILTHYIGGEFLTHENQGLLNVENPSTGDVIARVPMATEQTVNETVELAADAFKSWSKVSASDRVEPLFKLASEMRREEITISRILVTEMGKSLPDAKAELKRAIENIEVACGMPMMQMGQKLVDAAAGIDGDVIRQPIGVFSMIAPFNFPAMVPFWFIPYAIASGNTFVLKPSEQVPLTMQYITQLIDGCGFPSGVFNLVHGDKNVGEAFTNHPKVKGVSLVGTSKVCRLVSSKCSQENKRCQALGGAKNHLVVMPDAKIDEVVRNMITSCFGCAGQRCMAASAIVCVGEKTYETVKSKFVNAAQHIVIANPLDQNVADNPVVLGPVISSKAKSFIESMIATGVKEGANLALDGRGVIVPGCEEGHYIGPTIFTDVKPGMEIHRTEIFGPVVVMLEAKDYDEALSIVNDHEYGNGASIYTQNGFYARQFEMDVRAGMVGVNVGIPAPVAHLPFGGTKESLFADIKAQGGAMVDYFTEQKIITRRFWSET